MVVVLLAACSKKSGKPEQEKEKPKVAAVDAGAAAQMKVPDAAPPPQALMPPGVLENGIMAAVPAPVTGPKIIPPQRFRHSSVRGDFRIYKTAAGLVTSWHTLLSARTVDGAPLWKHENLGRAVAVSADGKKVVANNDAGDLMVLDTATGEPVAPATKLGGGDDLYISAFAWTPDGQHIIAVDSKKVFLLHADGTTDRELPVCPDGNCFLTSAIAVSNDEIILNEANNTEKGLQRVKLADGSVTATGTYQGANLDLSSDGKHLLVDGNGRLAMFDPTTLAQLWEAPLPGYQGVAFAADASASEQWKPEPKQNPDGSYIAVNDQAGRLWLLNATDGKPVVAYDEALVQYVEDVTWLDPGTLLAIDNAGHVLRIAGENAKVVWSQDDAPEPERWDEP